MDNIKELLMAKIKLKDTGHLDMNRKKAFDDAIQSMVFNEGYNACIDEILGDKE